MTFAGGFVGLDRLGTSGAPSPEIVRVRRFVT